MTDKKISLTFPRKFLWGASISAHQTEGSTNNQWTAWEKENAKSKAAQASYHLEDLESWPFIEQEARDPASYISGASVDHYHRYVEDFDLLTKMNMNAFRFSIEWSRVEQNEGAWNVEAIEHYKAYVAELRRRGIEPVVTLFHFTLPQWFVQKGGFEKRANIKYFVRFADKIIRELGTNIRLVITINEPEIYAYESYRVGNWPPNMTGKRKFLRVMRNLATAHNQAARAIRSINRRYKVSISKNSNYFYAGDTAWLSRKAAEWLQYAQDDYFLKKVVKECDFLGVNFYFSNRVYGYRIHNPEEKVSDMGWDLSPSDLQHALERLHEKYHLPIIITENGLADREDKYRQWWLTQTLIAMQKAMKNGVKLEGYLHWSLLDNFEWDKGIWPRFGLASVDYSTGKRQLQPSALWFAKVVRHIRETSK
jgi:beta-glucosidase